MQEKVRKGQWFWPGCFLLALLVRTVNIAPVFLQGGLRLIGTDPYYHLRRIHQIVLWFPHVPGFDPYLGHPYGALCPYEPGFDFMMATFVKVLTEAANGLAALTGWYAPLPVDEPTTGAICAALMPLFAIPLMLLYARIASRLAGPSAARMTAILVALLPGAAFHSQLGQVDHHVLEPLLTGLVLLTALDVFAAPQRARGLFVAAIVLGAGLAFWRGIILPAGLLAITLGLRTLWQTRNSNPDTLSRYGGPILFAGAALLSLPIGWASPVRMRLSYFTVSLLQPLIFLLLACSLALMGLLGHRLSRSRATGRQLPSGLARSWTSAAQLLAALVPFAAAAALIPSFFTNFSSGVGFLARSDVFVRSVTEQRPLFVNDEGNWSILYPVYFYGAFFGVAPYLAWRGWRKRLEDARGPQPSEMQPAEQEFSDADAEAHDFRWLLFVFWSAALLVMALTQKRYAALFTPFYAIWLALGWQAIKPALRRDGRGLQAVVATLATLLALPTAMFTLAQIRTEVQRPALLEAMSWIRAHTEETAAYDLPPSPAGFAVPEYGILAAWEEGHHLIALAHRPDIANPFGIEWFKTGLERAARFWTARGEDVAQRMDETNARFALLSFRLVLLRDEADFVGEDPDRFARLDAGHWVPGPDFAATGSARMYLEDGLGREGLPPVEGVRLVWEGGTLDPESPAAKFAGPDKPAYKLFERIQGYQLTSSATPGSLVRAVQIVRTSTGRRFEFQTSTFAGPDGRWRLTIPYASTGMPEGWASGEGPLTVQWEGRIWRDTVSDQQVRTGVSSDLDGLY